MSYEYLLFNLCVAAGPILASFEEKVHFVSRWPRALLANGIVMVPYLVWDALVAGSHWRFHGDYTLPFRPAGLPIGEWLFFWTVPFACLFVWEVISSRWQRRLTNRLQSVRLLLILVLPPVALLMYATGRTYSFAVLIALAMSALLDRLLNTHLLLQPRTYLYLALVGGLILRLVP